MSFSYFIFSLVLVLAMSKQKLKGVKVNYSRSHGSLMSGSIFETE